MDYEYIEIQSISLSSLPNGNHKTYNEQSLAIISGDAAVAEEFADKIAAWRRAFEEEDRVMEKITFSELTKRIADADNDRDRLYEMFMRIVRAYLGFTETAKREAAEKLERYAKQNKVLVNQQYDRETGNMSNFIQDMHQYCQSEVELLGLTDVLEQMNDKNNLVNQLLLERNEEYVDNKHIAVQQARRQTDEAYELVRKFINASALINGMAKYERVIDLMNQNIERTKLEVFKKKGQAGVNGGATEEGGEDGDNNGEQPGDENTPGGEQQPEGGENNGNQQPGEGEQNGDQNQQPGGGEQNGGGTTNTPSGPNTDAWGDGDEGDGSDV